MKMKTLLIACALGLAYPTGGMAQTKEPVAKPAAKKPAKSSSGFTRANAAKCAGSTCSIAVTTPNCTIAPEWEYLIVTGKNVKLRWVIQTKGYTFPEKDGIFFKKEYNPDYGKEFDECGRVNATTWECRDKNVKPPMVFKYGINVLKSDKTPCPTLDPTIINDM